MRYNDPTLLKAVQLCIIMILLSLIKGLLYNQMIWVYIFNLY